MYLCCGLSSGFNAFHAVEMHCTFTQGDRISYCKKSLCLRGNSIFRFSMRFPLPHENLATLQIVEVRIEIVCSLLAAVITQRLSVHSLVKQKRKKTIPNGKQKKMLSRRVDGRTRDECERAKNEENLIREETASGDCVFVCKHLI